MKESKLKVGVIGTGIGSLHIRGYQKLPDVEVVGVIDLDSKRAKQIAEEYKIPNYFSDYRKILRLKEIDAISVCTPNSLHAEVTVAALQAGKHVLCEKPMAMNSQQAQMMVNAAKQADRKLMMAFCRRFQSDSQWFKKYIEAGELGEIYYAKTGWLRRRGIPGLGGWFTTKVKSGGGPLIDLGVHMLDLVLWFMGNPRAVSVTGSTYAKFRDHYPLEKGTLDVEDLACAFIRLETGATVFLETSWVSNIKEEKIYSVLLGTKGGADLPPLKIYTEKQGGLVDLEPKLPEVSGFDAEVAHFVECILKDKEPTATAEQALEITRILEALYKSAETGKEVILK
ncbi:MAG: Gfo/Idh/MocA family oxidoreductase [Candidatus Latescibacteria bacterium]|nr:Gfo/Idh/MocA family oxidoreductase [Candidatus Latescibacterota bacterium]